MKAGLRLIKQTHSSGCGPTCIRMVAAYFGSPASKSVIESVCGNWKKDGMSNEELVRSINKLGLAATGSYDTTWETLSAAVHDHDKAIIVSWMLKGFIGHFSVVKKADKDHIWLADPESGTVKKLSKLVFLRLWFDYGDKWYPEVNTDFQMHWMAVVRKEP